MKALSIQQPWAWLIVHGYKDIENRTWATSRRGETLIHAGKTFDQDGYAWVKATFSEIPMPLPPEFERGGIVGRASLRDCVTASASRWFFGPHGFLFADASPLPFTPVRGMLGFFACAVPTPSTEEPMPDRSARITEEGAAHAHGCGDSSDRALVALTPPRRSDQALAGEWYCGHCRYLNHPSDLVCVACHSGLRREARVARGGATP